jgi:hypothetical protein
MEEKYPRQPVEIQAQADKNSDQPTLGGCLTLWLGLTAIGSLVGIATFLLNWNHYAAASTLYFILTMQGTSLL